MKTMKVAAAMKEMKAQKAMNMIHDSEKKTIKAAAAMKEKKTIKAAAAMKDKKQTKEACNCRGVKTDEGCDWCNTCRVCGAVLSWCPRCQFVYPPSPG